MICLFFVFTFLTSLNYASIKVPQRYAVQEGDATMSPNAKMPGQQSLPHTEKTIATMEFTHFTMGLLPGWFRS